MNENEMIEDADDQFRLRDDIDGLDEDEENEYGLGRPSDYKFIQNQHSLKKTEAPRSEMHTHDSHMQGTVSIEDYRKIIQENAELKEKEVKYVETIRHLKN
jgi:hypothetical protein